MRYSVVGPWGWCPMLSPPLSLRGQETESTMCRGPPGKAFDRGIQAAYRGPARHRQGCKYTNFTLTSDPRLLSGLTIVEVQPGVTR
jgi:hypothetical protein